jgi:hypothetical protein
VERTFGVAETFDRGGYVAYSGGAGYGSGLAVAEIVTGNRL